jgi:hypothetical protein
MDATASGSCPTAGFGMSSIETYGSVWELICNSGYEEMEHFTTHMVFYNQELCFH